MLTCYDYTTAQLMQESGVPMLLAGDSAASVILGHPTTVPVSLEFMIEITAAVRRGAPLAMVIGDMPFGSYQASVAQGVKNVCRMVQLSGCDCVKIEVADNHSRLVQRLADAGVAVIAHLGLRPQTVGLLGGYKYQGRTSSQAEEIVASALLMERSGAAALLVEAVPPEVSEAIVAETKIPLIGCGAGPACDASVVVTQDALGFASSRPRFVPMLGDVAASMKQAIGTYVQNITAGTYPGPEHQYEMPGNEKSQFRARRQQ